MTAVVNYTKWRKIDRFKTAFQIAASKLSFDVNPLYKDLDDLPASVWYKIIQTGDKSLLKKDARYVMREEDIDEKWMDLQDEYYEEFGTSPETQEYLYKANRLKNLYLDFVITEDRKLLNEINMLEKDLEPPKEGDEPKVDFYSTVDKVEVIRKFQLDLDKISTKRWYYILKNLRSHQQQATVREAHNDHL